MHALEQVLRAGHSQQGQYGRAARRLTGDRDPVGVPAEAPDVVPDPFEGQQPVTDGAVVRCVGDPSEAVEAEPVADRDDDHPVAVEGGAVVPGARLGSGDETAPVDPHHHRQAVVRRGVWGEHVEIERPVARNARLRDEGDLCQGAALCGRSVGGGVQDAGPGLGRNGRGEPEFADGRLGVGDAEEPDAALTALTAHGAVGGTDDGLLRGVVGHWLLLVSCTAPRWRSRDLSRLTGAGRSARRSASASAGSSRRRRWHRRCGPR